MANLNFTSFSNNTVADANAVTQNFQNIKNFLETNTVQVDGSVKATTASIDNLAITTAKIADDAVTADKVANGAVLPVDITGSAGAVAWANVSGKPAIGNVFNDGGTYGINVTGSSANAAKLVSGAGSIEQAGYWWNVNGEIDFQGLVFYMNPGPSSATEALVRISTGEIKKNSASGVSKREYKEDIVPMENALEQLSLLQPRNFRFKEEVLVPNEPYDVFNRRTQLQYGFVMEEVQDAVPDLVMHKSPDGIEHEAMYWKESGMIALAVAAIQELSAKVDALQAELDALKNV